jgi:cell division protease FtsH
MSDELGPMTFGRREEQVFLGRDIAHSKDYSEHTAVEIDREVRRIVDEAYQGARGLLVDHMTLLHALAERLLEKEVVEGAEVAEMLKAYKEGRPLASAQQPVKPNNPPPDGTTVPKEKPRTAAEENAPLPGLHPKPSLA